MGYNTDYTGRVTVAPPLNEHEIAYLRKFSETRRMARGHGPYFVDGSGKDGPGAGIDVQDSNRQPEGQPGVWCDWVPTEDGAGIEWDGVEKFYNGELWMAYLINTFLMPGAAVQLELQEPVPGRFYPDEFKHFTFDHLVSGVIEAQGDRAADRWDIVVENNSVSVRPYQVSARADG
ncbi:hypothetical protein [Umezawaea tangerina]|uniref:Uncharacterized protein n=1 Tax=Umezawaea tangerina TaxID=84725 RepID=A0A2T0SPP7_9PSEU|nr:hypothetical protein [Umezawaea tangerina]PRY35389.1 hypothetical protein CLV43_114307 [Umezawaea tangerina]